MITKQAGIFTVVISTDGSPRWGSIKIEKEGEMTKWLSTLAVDDLKDLHYCLKEALAKEAKDG